MLASQLEIAVETEAFDDLKKITIDINIKNMRKENNYTVWIVCALLLCTVTNVFSQVVAESCNCDDFYVTGNSYHRGSVTIGSSSTDATTDKKGKLRVMGAAAGDNWSYFEGNVTQNNPDVKSGIALGWNLSGTDGESNIVYSKASGAKPRLDFMSLGSGSAAPKMEMTLKDGKLGIGIKEPQGALHIGDVAANIGSPQQNWIYFSGDVQSTSPVASMQKGLAFGWNRSGRDGESVIAYSKSTPGARLEFSSWNGTNYTSEMTLNNGLVHIGADPEKLMTASAADRSDYGLWVDKKVMASDFSVQHPGAWADFVFSDDYKLPSLSEVASYIKINKHLPDVPAESDLIKDGYNVHDMNKLLIQKIEELTLYIIESDKKIQPISNDLSNTNDKIDRMLLEMETIKSENAILKKQLTSLASEKVK